eukprot:1152739-Pelagomonas_calceolata.AAC.1
MHAKHRLGYADCKTGYHASYQSLLPHANNGISIGFWNMPCISARIERTIFNYAQAPFTIKKHVVCLKLTTSFVWPLSECHHIDSMLHILSDCRCPIIRNMVTERHNIASRMALEGVSKGSDGSNRVHRCRQRRSSDPA